MDNESWVKSVYQKGINCYNKRADCIAQAVEKKMSLGNKSLVPYGMYPPDIKIYILTCNKNYGHLTKREKSAEYKYYFNKDGKVILTEHYNPHKPISDEPVLIHCFFFEYTENEVNIICTEGDTNRISFVAKCEFNDERRLTRYLKGEYSNYKETLGDEDIYLREMLFKYDNKDMYVTYNIYHRNLAKNYEPIIKTELYLCNENGIIKEL